MFLKLVDIAQEHISEFISCQFKQIYLLNMMLGGKRAKAKLQNN